jgi:hypothetical protein
MVDKNNTNKQMSTKITPTNEIWPTKVTPTNKVLTKITPTNESVTKITPTNKCRQSMITNKTFITETSQVVYVLKPFWWLCRCFDIFVDIYMSTLKFCWRFDIFVDIFCRHLDILLGFRYFCRPLWSVFFTSFVDVLTSLSMFHGIYLLSICRQFLCRRFNVLSTF